MQTPKCFGGKTGTGEVGGTGTQWFVDVCNGYHIAIKLLEYTFCLVWCQFRAIALKLSEHETQLQTYERIEGKGRLELQSVSLT